MTNDVRNNGMAAGLGGAGGVYYWYKRVNSDSFKNKLEGAKLLAKESVVFSDNIIDKEWQLPLARRVVNTEATLQNLKSFKANGWIQCLIIGAGVGVGLFQLFKSYFAPKPSMPANN